MSIDVSIVIAAYNVEDYIERAVMSALKQEDVTLEVLVIDDCSTDNTAQIVSKIDDPRLTYIKMPENGGPGAARNKGFQAAKGQWIAVLDGDDAFEPTRLANCLMRGNQQRADIIVDNITVYQEDDGKTFPMYIPQYFDALETIDLACFIREKLSSASPYRLGYLKPIFSAEFLKQKNLSYDVTLPIGEDYRLMVEALASGAQCVVEPKQGYIYTVRTGSTSHRLSVEAIRRIMQSDKDFEKRYRLNPLAAKEQNRRASRMRERLAYTLLVDAIKQKDPGAALKAIKASPTSVRYLWEPVQARIQRLLKPKQRIGAQE